MLCLLVSVSPWIVFWYPSWDTNHETTTTKTTRKKTSLCSLKRASAQCLSMPAWSGTQGLPRHRDISVIHSEKSTPNHSPWLQLLGSSGRAQSRSSCTQERLILIYFRSSSWKCVPHTTNFQVPKKLRTICSAKKTPQCHFVKICDMLYQLIYDLPSALVILAEVSIIYLISFHFVFYASFRISYRC